MSLGTEGIEFRERDLNTNEWINPSVTAPQHPLQPTLGFMLLLFS